MDQRPEKTIDNWRLRSLHIRDDIRFQFQLVICIIVCSSLTIGARTYNLHPKVDVVIHFADNLITAFFLLELLIRITAERPWYRFFTSKNGWNWFDFIIVVASLIPVEDSNYVVLGRLLRLFRVMRLISFIPQLRLLTSALIMALPRMGYVAIMMFVIFYMYAAVGSLLFEHIEPELWRDIGTAMLTLFRVATFEDWTDVMYATMTVYPLSWIYYITFIFLAAFTFLNMMIGIVINVLEEEHEKTRQDKRNESAAVQQQTLEQIQQSIEQLSQQIHAQKQQLQQLQNKLPVNSKP